MAEGWGVIEHIEIEGFKSLEKVSLDLGPLNIFVGTNASGKTNCLEALRVLQGIGYGYTVDEIFNGKPEGSNNKEFKPIRGGSTFASFRGPSPEPEQRPIGLQLRFSHAPSGQSLSYSIRMLPTFGGLRSETLCVADEKIYEVGENDALEFRHDLRLERSPTKISINRSRPQLWQVWNNSRELFRPDEEKVVRLFGEQLRDVQPLEPRIFDLKQYSTASRAQRMGEYGENFAALLKTIRSDPGSASAYVSWLKELNPAELDTIDILTNPDEAFTFAFRKGGISYPARVLSDGTLRFAAIAAAFFQPEPPCTLVLEEIEDGLHPSRLHLLIELLKSQVGQGVQQVFATSHSPYAIAWLREEDYKHVFLCTKSEETGATSITPFSEVPDLVELARTQSIADLFAEGWMENAI